MKSQNISPPAVANNENVLFHLTFRCLIHVLVDSNFAVAWKDHAKKLFCLSSVYALHTHIYLVMEQFQRLPVYPAVCACLPV